MSVGYPPWSGSHARDPLLGTRLPGARVCVPSAQKRSSASRFEVRTFGSRGWASRCSTGAPSWENVGTRKQARASICEEDEAI